MKSKNGNKDNKLRRTSKTEEGEFILFSPWALIIINNFKRYITVFVCLLMYTFFVRPPVWNTARRQLA